MHTNISDGELTPELLMLRANQMQLDYIAITDHDAVSATTLARQAKTQYSLKSPEVISGIEVSCRWHTFEIHVLGWNFDESHAAMEALVLEQQNKRAERARKIAEKLVKAGVKAEHLPTSSSDIDISSPRVLTRPHFADALVRHGYVKTHEQAFKQYLTKGARAYVPTAWTSIEDAVAVIKQAGGTTGLAHPLAYKMSSKWLRRLIQEFKAVGGDALEVVSCQQTKEQRAWLQELADTYQLPVSVGSDFHRPGPWRELGRNLQLPENATPVWSSWNITQRHVE
ncbi:PHP domain-containing protein [Aliidiomarina sp. B3213]|nr:PHP domain-containing protein [Aliidiomarina sp. B3213]